MVFRGCFWGGTEIRRGSFQPHIKGQGGPPAGTAAAWHLWVLGAQLGVRSRCWRAAKVGSLGGRVNSGKWAQPGPPPGHSEGSAGDILSGTE